MGTAYTRQAPRQCVWQLLQLAALQCQVGNGGAKRCKQRVHELLMVSSPPIQLIVR